MTPELIHLNAEEAVNKYLKHRKKEVSESTLQAHTYRLSHLVRWCSLNDIDGVHQLDPHHMQDYKYWRQNDGDLNAVSLQTQLSTLRVFIKWGEDYGAIQRELHKHIRIPSPENESREEELSSDNAELILDHFSKFEYASRNHALFAILWHTSMRIGGVRALDLKDFYPSENYVEVRHRPKTETPLKNKENGERPIYISDEYVTLLRDYINAKRHGVEDSHGRKPLITSENGRPSISTLRRSVYGMTRPCMYREGFCPHDRNKQSCDAAESRNTASYCPSSVSSHPIRRGSITHWLKKDEEGSNKSAIAQRVDSTEEVIEKHYDKRTELEKMEQRKDFFD